MDWVTKFSLKSMIIGGAIALSSCAMPVPTEQPSAPPTPSPSPAVSSSPKPLATGQSPKKLPEKQVAVTLYRVDRQCMALMPRNVMVPATRPMEGAIARLLEERDNTDFSLAGYRLTVTNGRATVDLRIATDSPRVFQSLSQCEQLELFGGIRKTLMGNPAWKIQSVRFTEKGEEILL